MFDYVLPSIVIGKLALSVSAVYCPIIRRVNTVWQFLATWVTFSFRQVLAQPQAQEILTPPRPVTAFAGADGAYPASAAVSGPWSEAGARPERRNIARTTPAAVRIAMMMNNQSTA